MSLTLEFYEGKFPNGIEDYLETHFEVVSILEEYREFDNGNYAHLVAEFEGTGGMYLLAEELTDEFETLYNGREWDGEFFEVIMEFVSSRILSSSKIADEAWKKMTDEEKTRASLLDSTNDEKGTSLTRNELSHFNIKMNLKYGRKTK